MKAMERKELAGKNAMVTLMRALWCHWLFTGGKCISKKELEATVEEHMADYKEQDELPKPFGLEDPRVGQNVQLIAYKNDLQNLDPTKRYALLKLISAEEIMTDQLWEAKLDQLEALGVDQKDAPLLRMVLQENTVPARPVAEHIAWEQNATTPNERTRIQEVDTNLWILKHMLTNTRVRLCGRTFDDPGFILRPDEETESVASADEVTQCSLFETVLETLIMSPLAARGCRDARSTFVPRLRDVLQRITNNWTEIHLDNIEEDDGPFAQGRTFVGCTSKQGEAVKASRDAQAKSLVAAQLLRLRQEDRKLAKRASEEAAAKFEEQRSKDRKLASDLQLKEWNQRYDELYQESVALNDQQLESVAVNSEIGLDPYGCAAVLIPPLQMLSLSENKALLTKHQQKGVEVANSFFLDVRMQEDCATYLKAFLDFTWYEHYSLHLTFRKKCKKHRSVKNTDLCFSQICENEIIEL
jgi:hypothetical protein